MRFSRFPSKFTGRLIRISLELGAGVRVVGAAVVMLGGPSSGSVSVPA